MIAIVVEGGVTSVVVVTRPRGFGIYARNPDCDMAFLDTSTQHGIGRIGEGSIIKQGPGGLTRGIEVILLPSFPSRAINQSLIVTKLPSISIDLFIYLQPSPSPLHTPNPQHPEPTY